MVSSPSCPAPLGILPGLSEVTRFTYSSQVSLFQHQRCYVTSPNAASVTYARTIEGQLIPMKRSLLLDFRATLRPKISLVYSLRVCTRITGEVSVANVIDRQSTHLPLPGHCSIHDTARIFYGISCLSGAALISVAGRAPLRWPRTCHPLRLGGCLGDQRGKRSTSVRPVHRKHLRFGWTFLQAN